MYGHDSLAVGLEELGNPVCRAPWVIPQPDDSPHRGIRQHPGDHRRVVGMSSNSLRLSFKLITIAEQETLTRALYSRADAWLNLGTKEVDRPLISLGRVVVLRSEE